MVTKSCPKWATFKAHRSTDIGIYYRDHQARHKRQGLKEEGGGVERVKKTKNLRTCTMVPPQEKPSPVKPGRQAQLASWPAIQHEIKHYLN